jgi:hypothetical protein
MVTGVAFGLSILFFLYPQRDLSVKSEWLPSEQWSCRSDLRNVSFLSTEESAVGLSV